MVLLISMFIIYFTWLGMRIFKGTIEEVNYFADFPTASWSLLVLLTTANFPDVMMPAYKVSRWYSHYFISYLIFGLFLLMRLLLAIFYSNYKRRYEDTAHEFMEQRNIFLDTKFKELDDGRKGYLTKKEAFLMFN